MKLTSAGILSAIFFALLPFATTNQVFYGPVNAKFFLIILFSAFLSLIAAYHFHTKKEGIQLKGRWFLGALGLTLAVQLLAAVLGVFPERSLWSEIFWSSGVLFLLHIGIIAWIASELFNRHDWSLVCQMIVISTGIFSLLTIFGIGGMGATGNFLWANLGEVGLTFGNETYAGTYLLLAFIVGLVELFKRNGWGRGRIVLGISVLLIALSPLLSNIGVFLGRTSIDSILNNPALLLGSARASSAALYLLLAFVSCHLILKRFAPTRIARRVTVGWGIILVVVTAIGVGLLFVPGSTIQNLYIKESTAARIIVWEASIDAIGDRPLLGWGPENFNYALERHFDTRLFLEENLGEIWFERGHNVFIDTLVASGFIGLVSFVFLSGVYVVVVLRARRRGDIEDTETALLLALIPAHLLQLQTGFDTVGSYTLLAFMGGYVLWLERGMLPTAANLTPVVRKGITAGFVLFAILSITIVAAQEYARQAALPATFKARTLPEQQVNMNKSLERISSFESLRLSSASFIKGALTVLNEKSTPERRRNVLATAKAYEASYKRYLEVQPDHYRANVNYAYLLIVMSTVGDSRIDDAKEVIAHAYELSPGNPLTYVMDALAELYRGNISESQRLIAEARALNPDIRFTQEAEAFLQDQWQQFPNVSVMRLTNL